jgi:hypothetical protein
MRTSMWIRNRNPAGDVTAKLFGEAEEVLFINGMVAAPPPAAGCCAADLADRTAAITLEQFGVLSYRHCCGSES